MKNLKIVIPLVLVLMLTFAAFSPCLKSHFINWDDGLYVTENTVIQNLSFHNVKKIFTSYFGSNYLPLTMLSYSLEYRFFKLDPFGYHLTNLILHLLNCLLVFWLIYLLTQRISISAISTLFFGLHPLHVESVAWVSERKDLLYALFFLAAMVSYGYYLRSPKIRRYYYLCLILFLAALLAKPMAITLPLVLLLIDYFNNRKADKRMFIDKIPFLILSLIFGVLAAIGQYVTGAVRSEHLLNFFHKIAIASYSIIFYLYKLVLPIKLSCLYPYSGVNNPAFLYSLAGFIVLLVLVIRSAKYTRKVIFGSAFFLVTLLPVLQFIPIGETIVADRYVYIASLGIFYILAEGIFWLFHNKTRNSSFLRGLLLAILIVLTSFLASLTWQRCQVWRDSMSLWNDVLTKHPNVATAFNNRGITYKDQGDIQQAISDYSKAIVINPKFVNAHYNRGIVYKDQGNIQQAISDFSKAIKIKPNYVDAYNNRGLAYKDQGNIQQAISDYNKVIEINPNFEKAYNNRGVTYNDQGDIQQAISDFNKAIEINPNFWQAYNNRGLAYKDQGDIQQAISDFNKAIEINPNYVDAYNNRGNTYADRGDIQQAIFDYNKAVAINPKYEKAYNNRGITYKDQGNIQQAISDFSRAIKINLNYAEAYNNRGNLYSQQGNFIQAFSDYTRAIEINPNYLDAYCSRGTAYSQQGSFAQAIFDFNRAIEINPNYAEVYNNRGIAYFLAKEYDQAWVDVHKTEELGYKVNPEFLNALKKASGRDK
jgi:protein O-mannosyl-transferase